MTGVSLHISLLHTDSSNGKSLQLSSRKEIDITVHNVVQLKNIKHLVQIVQTRICLNQCSDGLVRTSDSFGDAVDILRLNNCLQVIFEDFGEVI